MSEYEETGSLTKALAESFKGSIEESSTMAFERTGVMLPNIAVWERYAEAAIKAYELHQEATIAQVIYPNRTKLYWDGEEVDPKDLKP